MVSRIVVFLWLIISLPTFAADFKEGTDYQLIKGVSAVSGAKPEVLEFFNYGCPACYHVESSLEQWLAVHNSQINFSRTPVVFHKEWENYAKAYYALKLLGKDHALTPILFKTIQSQPQQLVTKEAMIAFLISQGLDKETIESAFNNSPTIEGKINEGNQLMARYYINSVPTFVVKGIYKTDVQMAQNKERLFKILDYLIKLPVLKTQSS